MNKYLVFFLQATFALWWGCIERDMDFDVVAGEPRLAIYGIIRPDNSVSVWVTQTKFVLDSSAVKPVVHAIVELSEEGQPPVVLSLYDAERGEYRATWAIRAGARYDLRVQAEGVPTATATTNVPLPVPITSITHEVLRINQPPANCSGTGCPEFYRQYNVALTLTDPSEENNYYAIAGDLRWVYQPYKYKAKDPREYVVGQDTITEALGVVDFSDQLFSGQIHTARYTVESDAEPVISFTVTLRTLHPDARRYQQSIRAQRKDDSAFGEPTQIYQNITGGYGIFSSYSQDTVVIELE